MRIVELSQCRCVPVINTALPSCICNRLTAPPTADPGGTTFQIDPISLGQRDFATGKEAVAVHMQDSVVGIYAALVILTRLAA